jgi:hypothetical protein
MPTQSDVYTALLAQASRIEDCAKAIKAAVPLDNGRAEFIASICKNLASTAVVIRSAARLMKNGR